eukprot:gene11861-5190_t
MEAKLYKLSTVDTKELWIRNIQFRLKHGTIKQLDLSAYNLQEELEKFCWIREIKEIEEIDLSYTLADLSFLPKPEISNFFFNKIVIQCIHFFYVLTIKLDANLNDKILSNFMFVNEENFSLTELDISNNRIDDYALGKLIPVFQKFKNLRILNLKNNLISTNGCKLFISKLHKFQNLKILNFGIMFDESLILYLHEVLLSIDFLSCQIEFCTNDYPVLNYFEYITNTKDVSGYRFPRDQSQLLMKLVFSNKKIKQIEIPEKFISEKLIEFIANSEIERLDVIQIEDFSFKLLLNVVKFNHHLRTLTFWSDEKYFRGFYSNEYWMDEFLESIKESSIINVAVGKLKFREIQKILERNKILLSIQDFKKISEIKGDVKYYFI